MIKLHRRSFVLGASSTVAAGAASTTLRALASAADQETVLDLSAVDVVARIVRGDLSAERYADALLKRCAAERALNAFITLEPDKVLQAARDCDRARRGRNHPGPLFGLPIPVKDSVNTRDYPTTAGTPALRHFRPAEDAPVVKALRTAGALVLGKTNLHELSWGWTSNNLAFGAVHNPYDHTRIPGGSSGGTAAAIAARMAPLGIAEDTEGSIRVPAALCGIMGLRPTTGRYSTDGCVPITPVFDQIGPHARTVADLALFDSVVANDWRPLQSMQLRGVRLGVVRDYWYTDLDAEVERITDTALNRLRDAGVKLVESELPGLARLIDLITYPVEMHDVRLALTRYLERYRTGVTFEQLVSQASADIQASFRDFLLPGSRNFISDAEYGSAVATHLPTLKRLYRDYFSHTGVAAVVFPATRVAALPIGAEREVTIQGRQVPFDAAIARNIDPGSTAGLPGLVLPAGLTSTGLPVGIELDAAAGTDRALLALGASVAEALGPLAPPPSTRQ
jgi:indoleacetamide hydrolase